MLYIIYKDKKSCDITVKMYLLWFTVALMALISSVSLITYESTPEPELNFPSALIDFDVRYLHRATNASDPNGRIVSTILTSTTAEEREQLEEKYFSTYNVSLLEDLKNTFSGKFQYALDAFMKPLHKFYAQEISQCIHNNNTQHNALIDSLCIFDDPLLNNIIQVYPQYANKKCLKDDLNILQPENFQKLMLLCVSKRKTYIMKQIGPLKSLKGDELMMYLSENSDEKFFQLILSFGNKTKETLDDIMSQKYEGAFQRALGTIIEYSQSEKLYFARRLHESLTGSEVDYNSLLHLALMERTVSSQQICNTYSYIYKEDLAHTIEKKIPFGNFRFFLVNLLAKKKLPPIRDELDLE
ncbi:annexin A13-like [Chelonus insularis]|uniref:annexin A13-like n=1 Tax=Chelonus insularis TaxID=460826 RepID=UPI00158F5FE5|nr:annexin A13-like [Chelonus insularis]